MMIAYTMANRRGGTDLLLRDVAEAAEARGLRLAGLVQINSECAPDGPCDMDVRVMPAGRVIRISQTLGPGARGCRLDSQALEEAAGLVAAGLDGGADLLLINKFGKSEAEGRGLRGVIAEAIGRGVPVLVGLNAANEEAFAAFAEGLAEKLPPDAAGIAAWIGRAVAEAEAEA